MSSHQAGWYPDPSGDASRLRYWNGTQWTNDYSPAGGVPQSPPPTYYGDPSGGNAAPAPTYYTQPAAAPVDSNKQTMRLIAFIFNIIATVAIGWTILPLAWMIPMSVMSWGIYKGTRKNSVAFGVCTLLFMGVVSGILLLVSGEDQ